jgi:hypothetical protein
MLPFHLIPSYGIWGGMGLTEPLGAHVGLEGVDVGVVGGHVRVGRLSRLEMKSSENPEISWWVLTCVRGTGIKGDVYYSAMS